MVTVEDLTEAMAFLTVDVEETHSVTSLTEVSVEASAEASEASKPQQVPSPST